MEHNSLLSNYKTKDELTTTENFVECVLKGDRKARDSDKWLILQVLRKMGFKIYVDYKDLEKMPSFETITRSRRKIQNQLGLFTPSKKADACRDRREQEFKEYYR